MLGKVFLNELVQKNSTGKKTKSSLKMSLFFFNLFI